MCSDPRCDGARLGHELFVLERSDPAVMRSAEAIRRLADRASCPDDYVRPENLQVDAPDE